MGTRAALVLCLLSLSPVGPALAQTAPQTTAQTTGPNTAQTTPAAPGSESKAPGAKTPAKTPGVGPAGAPRGPSAVGVMVVHKQDVPLRRLLPGRALAAEAVDVRPQAGGEVMDILFAPGATVAAGDPLFRLDDGPVRADLAAAEATVAGARAGLAAAEATVARNSALAGRAVSEAEQTAAVVALGQAQAQLKSAEAARDKAERAVDDTLVKSPIAGVTGLASVEVGDLVTAGQAAGLVTVTQADPIRVDVSEPAPTYLADLAAIAAGQLVPPATPQVRIMGEDGAPVGGPGRLVRQGTDVSPTTGTLSARYAFDGAGGNGLLPGQFVRVEITKGTRRAILVPQRATKRATSGILTAFVVEGTGDAAKAVQVKLTEDGTEGSAWVVLGGLEDGAAVVLDGLDKLQDGARVTTVPVTIDASGVVRQAGDATAADPPANSPANSPGATGTATPAPPAP